MFCRFYSRVCLDACDILLECMPQRAYGCGSRRQENYTPYTKDKFKVTVSELILNKCPDLGHNDVDPDFLFEYVCAINDGKRAKNEKIQLNMYPHKDKMKCTALVYGCENRITSPGLGLWGLDQDGETVCNNCLPLEFQQGPRKRINKSFNNYVINFNASAAARLSGRRLVLLYTARDWRSTTV